MKTCVAICLITCFVHCANINSRPQLTIDDSGNAFALWENLNGSHYFIEEALFSEMSGWMTSSTLSSSGSNAFFPSIARNQNNQALAVWQKASDSNLMIQASSFSSGSWSSPQAISGTIK